MRTNEDILREGAEMLAFEHYLRTGRLLGASEIALSLDRKFNPFHDPANGLFTTGPSGQGNPHEIVVYGRRPDKAGSSAPKWKAKSDAVRIPDAIHGKVDAIASDYHAVTGKTLTVTDGMRTPSDQAKRVYYKFSHGDFQTYRGAQGAELARLYRAGITSGKSKSQILSAMAGVINHHLKQGLPISKHLLGMGVDFRVSDLNQTEKDALRIAIRNNGGKPLDEGIPPHIHASF